MVPLYGVDDLVEMYGFDKVDVLKIDTEGAWRVDECVARLLGWCMCVRCKQAACGSAQAASGCLPPAAPGRLCRHAPPAAGYDMLGLQSAQKSLQQGKVRALTFEYHGIGLWPQYRLEDVVQRMDGLNFACYYTGEAGGAAAAGAARAHGSTAAAVDASQAAVTECGPRPRFLTHPPAPPAGKPSPEGSLVRLTGCWSSQFELHGWSNIVSWLPLLLQRRPACAAWATLQLMPPPPPMTHCPRRPACASSACGGTRSYTPTWSG